jgi:dUTP pyrophosphatase
MSAALAPELAQVAPLLVKRLSKAAVLPVRSSPFAAGYDLAAAEETVIRARGKGLVKTDLAISLPPGTYGRVAPRSGLGGFRVSTPACPHARDSLRPAFPPSGQEPH